MVVHGQKSFNPFVFAMNFHFCAQFLLAEGITKMEVLLGCAHLVNECRMYVRLCGIFDILSKIALF